MILTPEFVYLHEPKTGGTFVTHWLAIAGARRAAREPRWSRLLRRRPRLLDRDKHGTARDVPRRWRGLPLVASVRDPHERAVSQFAFAWWRRVPDDLGEPELVRRHAPNFPDLDFGEFLDVTTRCTLPQYRNTRWPDALGPGLQTKQFLHWFGRDPLASFASLDSERLAAPDLADELFPVHFLPCERLAESLYAFLLERGYAEVDLAGLLESERVWPPEGGRPAEADWRAAFPPELRATFHEREALLFQLFPRYAP